MSTLTSWSPSNRPRSERAVGLGALVQAGQAGLRPEPRLSVSEWADAHRLLPDIAAEPGRWRTSRTPYLQAIMEALSPHHPAERVVFMKGAQVGATEAGNCWLGFIIHHAPGLMLLVMPGLSEVKRNSSTRIDPLIESTPELKQRVVAPRSRDPGNSIFRKKFPGGELVMTGANSAVGLRSTPARYLFLDEVDGYPGDADGEGDPVDLALKRTVTFRGRRKIFMVSTPTVDGLSRIQKAYEESDQRRYFVPCKHCNEYAVIVWDQIQWPKDEPQKARYICPRCHGAHEEHDKAQLLAQGEWRATVEGDGRIAGFHLPAFLSPFESWGDQAEEFRRVHKDPNRLKVWVNTVLGETWQEQGEAPEWERLYERRETYPIGTVPRGGLFLTAGVDVQKDRIEAEVVAWGRGKRSWSVDYRIMEGDTSNIDDPVWLALRDLIGETWSHASGLELGLEKVAIDEGFNTQVVRDWARRQATGRVMVVKGQDRGTALVGLPTVVDITIRGKRIPRGMRVWPVVVSQFKAELYGWLQMERPTDEARAEGAEYPPGYCHFPEYGEEYFKQLTAEQLVRRTKNGYTRLEWQKLRDRNEALDCRVYARAAAFAQGMDRWKESVWIALEKQFGPVDESAPAPSTPEAPASPPPSGGRRAGRRQRGLRRQRR